MAPLSPAIVLHNFLMSPESTIALINEVPSAIFFALISLAIGLFIICTYQSILKAKASYQETVGTFISGFLLLLLTYNPIISAQYVFNDDYYLWSWQQGMCQDHPEYLFALSIGRPMANLFLCPALSIVDTLEGANLVRLGCIFLTTITFFVINRFLIYLRFNKIFAYLIALTIVTSFAFQAYNAWLMATYIPIGIIFAIFSIFIAIKSIELTESSLGKITIEKLSSLIKKTALYILSIIFYLLTLSTYQPCAGFFTVFVAIYLLKSKQIKIAYLRSQLIVLGSIFCISNLIYFITLKTLVANLSYENFPASYDPHVLESVVDVSFIFQRLIWFFKAPLLNAANILNLENIALSVLCLVAVAGSLVVLYLKDSQVISGFKGKFWLFIGKYLVVVLCIPLTYLSILVSKNGDVNYRTIVPLSVFCFITILLGLETVVKQVLLDIKCPQYSRKIFQDIVLSCVLLFICVFNLVSARSCLETLSYHHSLEHRYLKEKLNSIPMAQLSRIMLITPIDTPIIDHSNHDLNYLSSSNPDVVYSMISSTFPAGMVPSEFKKIRIVVSHKGQRSLIQPGLAQDSNNIELVNDGYEGFNILKVGDYFYGILQGEGEFSLGRLQHREYSTFFVDAKESNVKDKIDQYVEASEHLKEILADESYREFQELQVLRDKELIIDMNKANSLVEQL